MLPTPERSDLNTFYDIDLVNVGLKGVHVSVHTRI